MSVATLYRWHGADLEIRIHAQPGARRTEIQGIHAGALRIRLQGRATEGAANEALLEFLAGALHVPRRQCVLVSGETSRRRRVRIQGPDRTGAETLLALWLQTNS